MQDSQEDWAQESARMKDVYAGAMLTIAAISFSSVQVGMLRERSISTEVCMIEWRSAKTSSRSNVFLRSATIFSDTTTKEEPANQRGWILQEVLLSPRMLSYGSQQMIWDCQECNTSESGRPVLSVGRSEDKRFIQSLLMNRSSIGNRAAHGFVRFLQHFTPCGWSNALDHRKVYKWWYIIVQDFCRREFIVESDAFPALSGLAKIFQNSLHDQYCGGLWRYDMIRGLLWTRLFAVGQKVPSQANLSRVAHYKIPSWGWASISGRSIRFVAAGNYPVGSSTRRIEEVAKVIDCHTKLSTSEPFGMISGGHVVLRAPFLQIDDPRAKDVGVWNQRYPALSTELQKHMRVDRLIGEFNQQHKGYPGQEFALIRLVKTFSSKSYKGPRKDRYAYTLILESTGKRKNEYRRIGLLIIGDKYECWDEMDKAKWKWKKVRLG